MNDYVLPITENLHDAFVHIEGRLIYTDRLSQVNAIGINQQDLPKRSYQVRFMKPIHEGAMTVGVCLGKPDDNTENDLAVKKMAELN